MPVTKSLNSNAKDSFGVTNVPPEDKTTTLELLGLLTAAQYYAKKLEAEKGETRVNYVKMIDMLVAYLRKDLA